MKRRLRKVTASICAMSVGFIAVANANAQETKKLELVLEPIIVTANKREQTLQDISVSVSVTSAETLERSVIRNLEDLQGVTPSLYVSRSLTSTATNYLIRGFGNGGINSGLEPSVGVFVDGVYRSRPSGTISDLPNLKRIEVLRGPQSTLFGKNASAGVISLVTQKPTGETNGRVSATLGNYSQVVLNGFYESSFSDSAAFSVYASTNTRDGYAINQTTGNDLNDQDRQNIRGELLLNSSDNTEIRFVADYDTLKENCCASVNLALGPRAALISLVGGQQSLSDPEALDPFLSTDPTSDVDNGGLSMHIEHDFNNMTLSSITAFRSSKAINLFDPIFTSANIVVSNSEVNSDTFTQELRLASNNEDGLNWMVGGFFFDDDIKADESLPYGAQYRPFADIASGGALSQLEGLLGLPIGQAFFSTDGGVAEEFDQSNQSFSLFGQVDWNISDALTATVGLNYTNDKKDVTATQTQSDLISSLDFVQIGFAGIFSQLTGGLPATPANIGRFPAAAAQAQAAARNSQFNPLLGLTALQLLPNFVDFPNSVESGQSNDDELSYNLRLSYDINDDFQVYAGVSTGFKATSWNLSRDSRPFTQDFSALQSAGLVPANVFAGTRFASPEDTTLIELGLKTDFERGSLYLTLFDQNIEGYQSNSFQGNGFNLTNAGELSVKGVELELTYYPGDSLQLNFAGTYMDSLYDSFVGAGRDPLTGMAIDLSGERPAGFSEFSFSTALDYAFNVGAFDAHFRLDYFYQDEVQAVDLVPASLGSRDRNIVNTSLSFITQNDLQVSLWARNLTDHVSLITAFPQPLLEGSGGFRTAPRTYGVTLSKDF